MPAEQALDFFRTLLGRVYQEPASKLANLLHAGFRILPVTTIEAEPLPTWAHEFVITDDEPLKGVEYLLTFRPFRDLPAAAKRKYFAGELHLLPLPGSFLFWGCLVVQASCRRRSASPSKCRSCTSSNDTKCSARSAPQSGWFEEVSETESATKRKKLKEPGWKPIRDTFKRIYRQARRRIASTIISSTLMSTGCLYVLFSTRARRTSIFITSRWPRNVQLWDSEYHADPRCSR